MNVPVPPPLPCQKCERRLHFCYDCGGGLTHSEELSGICPTCDDREADHAS